MVDVTAIARGASRNNQPHNANAIPPEGKFENLTTFVKIKYKDIEEAGPGIEEIDEEEEFPLLTKERKQDIKKFETTLSI